MSDGIHHDQAASHDVSAISALLSGIVQDAQKLIAQQIDLVRQEIKEDVRTLAYAAALVSVGAVLCAISVVLLCFMVVYVFHEVLDFKLWSSFLITGAIFLGLGGLLLFLAVRRVTAHNPLPDQTLLAMKENIQWKTNPK